MRKEETKQKHLSEEILHRGTKSHPAKGGRVESTARSDGDRPFRDLQHSAGNQAMLRLLGAGAIQASLRVSQPGDADEVEADRAAERVVSSPAETVHRK